MSFLTMAFFGMVYIIFDVIFVVLAISPFIIICYLISIEKMMKKTLTKYPVIKFPIVTLIGTMGALTGLQVMFFIYRLQSNFFQ